MIVVDTTVLVYAVGADHPLREPCRAVVSGVESGRLTASTTIEVIQEFCQESADPTNCEDDEDNDNDGFTDCDDFDCAYNPEVTACADVPRPCE